MKDQNVSEKSSGDRNDQNYDVIVVGGGAAGLSAALVLGRARRRVLVVDAHNPRNAPAEHMQGFLSRDGMPPLELLEKGRDEVLGYGGVIVTDFVEKAEPGPEGGFGVTLASGCQATARHLLVATGLTDELPDIPGLRDRWGRDVQACPYCHGWEVRDQALGVIGTGPMSVHHVLLIRHWSTDVVFFPHRMAALDDADREKILARGIRIAESPISRVLVEDDAVRGVELDDGTAVARTALFVGTNMVPNNALLSSLGCATGEGGWTTVDAAGQTTVPGVWTAGNVADPRAMVLTSAAAGLAAAVGINMALIEEETAAAVVEYRRRGEG